MQIGAMKVKYCFVGIEQISKEDTYVCTVRLKLDKGRAKAMPGILKYPLMTPQCICTIESCFFKYGFKIVSMGKSSLYTARSNAE